MNVSFYTPTITSLPYGNNYSITDNITVSNNTQYHQLSFAYPLPKNGVDGINGTNVSFYPPKLTSIPYNGFSSVNDTITYVNNVQCHQLDFSIPSDKNGLSALCSIDPVVNTLD